MAKYLRDLSFGMPPKEEGDIEFALGTNFLEILYLDSLPRVETGGIAKVVVAPCQAVPENSLELLINPDVCRIWKQFDFGAYRKADKTKKKRMALHLLQEGLLEVARAKGWEEQPFQTAYELILEKNFVNYRPWSKVVTGPDRRYKAQVWCDYDSDKAEIFVVIFRGKEIVKKELVVTVKPGDVWIRDAAGKLQWESKNKVKLTSQHGTQSWEVEITP